MSNVWSVGCKIVAWITLIGGIIAGIIVARVFERWWIFFAVVPSSVVTFLLFGTLGYIAENVESRGYSAPPAWLNATSDAPYMASSHSSSPEPAKPWTCPKCGRYNISMAEICECGASRPLKKAPNKNAWSDAWTCPDCGRVNPSYNGTCACGKVRPK